MHRTAQTPIEIARARGRAAADEGVRDGECPYPMSRLPERAAWRNARADRLQRRGDLAHLRYRRRLNETIVDRAAEILARRGPLSVRRLSAEIGKAYKSVDTALRSDRRFVGVKRLGGTGRHYIEWTLTDAGSRTRQEAP